MNFMRKVIGDFFRNFSMKFNKIVAPLRYIDGIKGANYVG
jgi:hypothetical protein